jgi:hypothetical protein
MISGRRSAQNVGEKTLNSRLLPSRRRPQGRAEPFSQDEAEALPLLLNLLLRSRYQNTRVSPEPIASGGGSCLTSLPLSLSPHLLIIEFPNGRGQTAEADGMSLRLPLV